ncbi:IS110 family transposase [Geothrix fermentans]|uniref:IS110 family transposase n=1 Tax=Geothrix fermentans TaxID=44676 RepID=UPI00041FBD5D|nr:IS110 family transposase [Geothrix fermentans]
MTRGTSAPTLPVHWAGADLAKASLDLALWGHEDLPRRRVRSFPRTQSGAAELLAWMKSEAPEGTRFGLAMESTGAFAEELATWLSGLDPELHLAIVNPIQSHAYIRSLGLRNKTDNLDARALAGFGSERRPRAWEKPSLALAELKDLARIRADLVDARVAMRLRLKDHPRAAKGATRALEQVIKTFDQQIGKLEAAIRAHMKHHEALGAQVKRLTSIKGVGLITAVTIVGELGDLRRFIRSRQLTAFAGVSPRKKESGISVRGTTRLCKQGNARVRAALYMAAMSAVRSNPDLADTYASLLRRGLHWRAALGAVMRKLLVLMRAVLKAEHDWVPKIQAA